MQNWILKKPAASSLAPSDKYHKNPQGGHRHTAASTTNSGGGGETSNTTNTNNHSTCANNNHNFSHNGIPPPISSSSSSGATESLLQPKQQQYNDQLIQTSSYHFYPSNSVGSSSIGSSSHHLNHHHQQQLQLQQQQPLLVHQPPYLYKSNHSSSGGSCSGNGSHIIIDGSNNSNGAGSVVEGSNNKKYYYYYNGHYYPTTGEEEDPDQIFTITAFTSGSGSGKQITMGRVGEDIPGSPASIGKGNGGTGLFKSKSSSIPVTSASPQPHHRGFRDTFISSMSPPVQVHSAESSPLHRSASAATANSSDRYSGSSGVTSGNNKQENKKWSFGGLFRRNKSKASATGGNNNSVSVENGATSSANNSHCNSPAKVNNNYGSGSPIIIPTSRTGSLAYSPATRPASSVGFISIDPNVNGYSENHRPNTIISSGTPKFVNAESQTRAKGKLSESDISTCDSDLELELPHHHDNPPEPAPQENKGYKQNFLVRRLSRRKEKAAAKKAALAEQTATVSTSAAASPKAALASASNRQLDHNSSNGFTSSQQHGSLDVAQMKRRVGSSPDSLNNSSEPWPSWETTKKPQTQLQALQQEHRVLQNYSSNGSLSVSQEGYTSNNNSSNNHGSKSTRAAAREAVKARAIARRESFLRDSSSSDDDTEERSQRSSLQGSFSSLNSRNRRQKAFNMQQAQFQQQRHLFPATSSQAAGAAGISCASPSSPMPVPLDYRNSAGMSPNLNRRLMMMGAPGSPKWETRVIYQQQEGATAPESNQPVVVRLPRKERMSGGASADNPGQMSQNNGDQGFIMATELISEDQHVVTAGLKVPFLPVQNQQQQCLRNGQLMYPDDPVQYANVANGMRGRSCTPYMGYNNGVAGGGAIHHASPTPPPPPPPRRDFTTATNNPNFYRPVSCSYLDAYANQLQMSAEHQQQMRQQSPMVFNGNYIYSPNPQQQQHHHQYQGQQQQQEIAMNGFASHSPNPMHNLDGVPGAGIARSSPRHFVPTASTATGNSNQPDVDGSRHPPLTRCPSEPPIIRAKQTRISSPVKRLISSPMSNGNGSNGESHQIIDSSAGGKSSPSGKSVITSKLGFPVRRLQETSKLAAGPQTPVHLRASEFWRKKETEVTGSPSPVGAANAANSQQKKYLNRIRSADSSPLPVPKMRKSPGGVVASNESISSLSSFSENAASPGPPKNFSSPITNHTKQLHQAQATPIRAQISKTPNPQQLTYGNNNKDKENNNTQQQSHQSSQSAVERLKVRIPSAPDGIKSTSSSTNPPPPFSSASVGGSNNKSESNNNPIRALIELNNGKTPGKNLEDALNELEDMYKSLRLSDEDLLDRAERRDLPTAHQELRDAPLIPIPQAYHRFEHLGSAESLGTGSGSGAGTNYTTHSGSGGETQTPRVRAPSVRRSSRPDTVSDDMANRRLAFPDGKPLDPRVVVAKTGSYLARSPAFSPCTSPCPPEGTPQKQHSVLSLAFLNEDEPDVTLDDVTFRNYKRANSIRIIDPQPPFGIPLGPITAAPATDYLHLKPSETYRPFFGHLKNPDVVNDDIAFRNLRKDLGTEAALTTAKDWTPRLFSPNREVSFNYPKVKDSKKLRAIRSLSANITHMLPHNNNPNSNGNRGSPTSSLFQQQQRYDNYIGKWNSFTDLHRRASAGSPAAGVSSNHRASSYLQPSWVEQIEKVQTSTETLTDHRNSSGASRLATAILDPPEHWERKFPKKTVDLTPPIYDPAKPRRPWTDIILESFERERQKEMERIAAEAEAAAAANANNKTEAKSELLEDDLVVDDDVFMDGSEEASKSETAAVAEQVKISGNSSKNNDPERRTPNMDISLGFEDGTPPPVSTAMLVRPLPLLSGQKTRRGSWVEPSRSFSSSAAFHPSSPYSPDTAQSSASIATPAITSHHQDKRRKSWSDLPKDIDSFSASTPEAIILSGSSCSASPTRKLFNPLPPPKKIRQINLEAFNNNSNNNSSNPSIPSQHQQPQYSENQADQVESNLSSANGLNNVIAQFEQAARDNDEENCELTSSPDKVKSSSAKSREEDELNELMDQLLKDADACGQSIDEDTASSVFSSPPPNMKMNERAVAVDKNKSICTTPEKASLVVNTQKKEMKMDGETSSSEQSCKQDLSCTIVGMIPKQQSPPPPTASAMEAAEHRPTDTNNRKVEQEQQQPIPAQQQEPINWSGGDGGSGARKVLKIDNSNEKGNVVGVPKEPSVLSSSDPSPILEGKLSKSKAATTRRTSGQREGASSIEDLIESINETLPELEASCSGSIGMITSSSHSSDGKPNGSSSASGSPASSIPSPSPGSPTPPVLSVRLVKKDTQALEREMHDDDDDDDGSGPMSPSSSAFPVPAKRHHLPGKGLYGEESLYENLPAATITMRLKNSKTGNDEKVYSSSPFHCPEESESRRSDPYQRNKASEEKVPAAAERASGASKRGAGRRALHDSNNDEDNEEEDAQHSSSHQPSSLSSNDSSDVSGGGGGGESVGSSSPRGNDNHTGNERQRQKKDNANANNNNRDNNNEEDQVEQTCSSSSSRPASSVALPLPSSLPFDAKPSSISPFDNTTTFTNKQNNNNQTSPTTTRRLSSNSNASSSTSSSSSARGAVVRKKSEGTKEEEDKKMMKNTRSTRRESRSSKITGRSRSCASNPTRSTTTTTTAATILLDFLESGEKRKGESEEHEGNKSHQIQGFTRSRQLYGSHNITKNSTTPVVNPPPAQTNSNFWNESETCPAFLQLSPGESSKKHRGGILSKGARRARMFQLSSPAPDLHADEDNYLDLSSPNYHHHKHNQHSLDKTEKWRKMIEMMEESPLLVSPPKSITQSGKSSRASSAMSSYSEEQQLTKTMVVGESNSQTVSSSQIILSSIENSSSAEGCLQPHPSEQLNRSNSKSKASQQKNYPVHPINLSQQQRGAIGGSNNNNKNGMGRLTGSVGRQGVSPKQRETFIGSRNLAYSSSQSSSSAAEERETTSQGKRKAELEQQPVARSRTTAITAFSTSSGTHAAKKSATSTTLALATPSTAPTETSASEAGNGGISFLRNNFPFFRNSTSRSRSQSVISDVSRSSETGDSKRERDKSYRRKSHLNRAFTDEPVPDNNYTFDTTPKSSKAASQDPSSLENSAVEESRANHKPAVKLHPAIPPVLTLTSNKSESNMTPSNKSISRNNSYSHNESIPSPVPTNSHKSSPVAKKDSFSDAEGVSFIKKMLQKESDRDRAAAAAAGPGIGSKQNCQNGGSSNINTNGGGSSVGYNIKKSPSAGNQSYWSKFSSSQSAFLRKLFEKPKVSESPVNVNKPVQKTNSSVNCTQSGENPNGDKDSSEKENAEPVLAFSVAQKASYFMKLEHEQRFSKWRKNSVDLGVISSVNTPSFLDQTENLRMNPSSTNNINEVKPKSRFLTRPVTPSEGIGTGISSNFSGNLDRNNMEFGSLPRIWGNNFHPLENNVTDISGKISNANNPSIIPTSSCTDYGDKQKLEPPQSNNKFIEISTRNLEPISPYTIEPLEPAVKSFSLTRSNRHTGNAEKNHQSNLSSFPMYHSASAIINTTATTAPSSSASAKHSSMKPSMKFYKNLGNAYSSSSSSFSEAMSRNESMKYLPSATKAGIPNRGDPPTLFENDNDKRRGSASDLEMSAGPANNQSPLMSRSEKVKSMFISRNRYHGDTDNLSEDGEVSSGGQEVAEIICRSYENSPVFRKKNWRTQKAVQSNFTKEIWRRCGNYENWSQRSQPPPQNQRQSQHPHPQTFTATTNVIEVTTIPPTSLASVAASPPPATSNLLQILTVLSSSNDELNSEPKPKSKKHRQGSRDKVSGNGASSRPDSIPPIHPNHIVLQPQPRLNTANCFYNNSVKNSGLGPVPTTNHRHTMPPTPLADSDEIFVSVPHPEDEAFQSFFCSVKSYTQVTHYPPPANGVIMASSCPDANNEHLQRYVANGVVTSGDGIQRSADLSNETLDISSVQRESDLLVMKKNVPACKRKSAGSKYKNPLRALAARMDFRQQGYTQTHSTNSNMVQCSSDLDVST